MLPREQASETEGPTQRRQLARLASVSKPRGA